MVKMYRQGDVLLLKVEKLPNKKRKQDTDIILKGEVTGHAHKVVNATIYFGTPVLETDGESFRSMTVMYVQAKKGAKLVHEEHGPIDLEPGIYEVRTQREYDGIDRPFRQVID